MGRMLDIIVSIIALTISSPLMLLITLVIRLLLGNPILFWQRRPGINGKLFDMVKFRSMREDANNQGNPLPDADRLTRLGKFLRTTSLDELPGLWNVLKGEMSLVGPRPLLMEYLPLYSKEQMRRHEVKPGITGWAQVNGRNAISWDEKFKLDVWYVDNKSFWLDVKILWLTVLKVFRRDGISQDGHATMEKFRGSL